MNAPQLKRLSILVLLFCLSSCSVLEQAVQKPEIYINNVELDARNVFSPKLIITLNVVNPNAFDLAVTGMNYRVNILNVNVLSGASNDPRRFKALSESPLVLEANTDIAQLLSLANELRKLGKGANIPYDASLTIQPEGYLPSISINKADSFTF